MKTLGVEDTHVFLHDSISGNFFRCHITSQFSMAQQSSVYNLTPWAKNKLLQLGNLNKLITYEQQLERWIPSSAKVASLKSCFASTPAFI